MDTNIKEMLISIASQMRIAIPAINNEENGVTKAQQIVAVKMFEDVLYGVINNTPLITAEDMHEAYTTSCREFYMQTEGDFGSERNYYIISTYLRERNYGGAEEGGWWYSTEKFIESKQFPTYDEAIEFMRTQEDQEPSGENQFYMEAIIGQNEDITSKHYE